MLKIDFGWESDDVSNVFLCQTALVAGTLVSTDNTDATTTGVGDCPFGNVVAANVSAADPVEIGVLLFDVKTGGPSFQEVIGAVGGQTTEVTATGYPCNVWHTTKNDVLSTDQFLSTGTGAITVGAASGNTPTGSLLGILNGKYVLASAFTGGAAGSVARAKLIGNATQGNSIAVRVQVL